MYKYISNVLSLVLFVLLITGLTIPATGQINVTFQANTSTVTDTLEPHHVVQIRGAVNGQTGPILPGGVTISWDASSDLLMSNDGGDYWSITFQMNTGDTMRYKFWTGYDVNTGTFHNGGWESDLNATNGLPGGNRAFIAGSSDTTVQIQYPNNTGQTQNQLWRPYPVKADSVAIYFRVNMSGVRQDGIFDPAVSDTVGVRGDDATSGGQISWGSTNVVLSREIGSVDDDAFWSGVAYIPQNAITVNSVQAYKFVFHTGGAVSWEDNVSNRTFTYTANLTNTTMDTTLHFVYFDDNRPSPNPIETHTVIWRASTEALEGLGLFDRSLNDSIKVIGPNGWTRPDDYIDMTFQPLLKEWTGQETFTLPIGTEITYKYFIVWDSSRVDTNSPNYIDQLSLDNGWEEPAVTGGGNRVHIYRSEDNQQVEGDFGFDNQFFASVPPNGTILTPINLTWSIDMNNAANPDSNTLVPIFNPATDSVWVQWDGELVALTQGFPIGGEDARFLLLTDPDQDMIYEGTFTMQPPSWYQHGYIIAYGSNGTYQTNGGGFDRGRRYYQYVWPTSVGPPPDLTTTWPSDFTFPTLNWKQSNLTVEPPPNLTTPSAIGDHDIVALRYELAQNYPNPFNPTTTIRYRLPKTSNVTIAIYNVNGQLVKTVVDEKQSAGKHSIVWNGRNDAGVKVASGVYFMQMRAGEFSQSRKMILLK